MRISTNTIFSEGINRISSIQNDQLKLQQQISTGKKFNSPSDDPIGSVRALDAMYAMEVNNKYGEIRKSAQNTLESLEGNLTSVTNLIVSAQSTLISAANGSLSDLERTFKATDLQNTYDALLGLANSQDASGNYVYSGFKTDTKPFIGTSTGATYIADSNQIKFQVSSQRQMPVSFPGDKVFQNGTNDTFAAFQDIITLLKTPITNPTEQATFNTGMATAISKFKGSLDNILNVRAQVGSQLNEIDELNISGDSLNLQYQSNLSDIQDLDYAKALSDLSKSQIIMQAAQKSFTTTSQLSLFDYIR